MVQGVCLYVWAACALLAADCAAGAGGGGSLRGALEALQRRQRARTLQGQPASDYDLYDLFPPDYNDPEYTAPDNVDGDAKTKYIIKVLEDDETPSAAYEYKIVKKKTIDGNSVIASGKKESAFRERSRHSDNDRLRELFMDKNDVETKTEGSPEKAENDAEYALLLGQLWSKYKNRYRPNYEAASGVVKLYKERNIKKRLPDNWGPVAFKRKRSPNTNINNENADLDNYLGGALIKNDKTYLPDDDRNDMTEEYTIAFQPSDDEGIEDFSDEYQYPYDGIEKRFPVTKRSSGPFDDRENVPKKRFVQEKTKRDMAKRFRSSSGTDPRIVKDLSKIFGDPDDTMKVPVKRSSKNENSHESKSPQITVVSHNHTHEHNISHAHSVDSHELHSQNIHHPGTSGKEEEVDAESDGGKPIILKKKSIDWSNYFGIDKRKKNFVSSGEEMSQEKLRKQYFNTFNKEVVSPVDTFRKHSNVKKNINAAKSLEEKELQTGLDNSAAHKGEASKEGDRKFEDIDQKLKSMEGYIVDEALRYSDVGEELDSKEEQELKEQMITRLAAAYSLEKMRKALKEFKQSLQIQRHELGPGAEPDSVKEAKVKRIAVKKEKAEINKNDISSAVKARSTNTPFDDFENQRGAVLYVSGAGERALERGEPPRAAAPSAEPTEEAAEAAAEAAACPVLGRAAARCRGVAALGGRRARLFLPLCSLHQICYLCDEAPPTACDLAFLSEAEAACGGEAACARLARAVLGALRGPHAEPDGECAAPACARARRPPHRRR